MAGTNRQPHCLTEEMAVGTKKKTTGILVQQIKQTKLQRQDEIKWSKQKYKLRQEQTSGQEPHISQFCEIFLSSHWKFYPDLYDEVSVIAREFDPE